VGQTEPKPGKKKDSARVKKGHYERLTGTKKKFEKKRPGRRPTNKRKGGIDWGPAKKKIPK